MRTSEILLESLSRVAFHYTNVYKALKILTSGNFELTSILGTEVEQELAPKEKPYFLSTTRTRHGGYHKQVGPHAAMFVLDGDWYNRHYVSKPVDYWEIRDPIKAHGHTSEAEDIIFSKSPTIPIEGVTAVHIYVSPEAEPATKAKARQALIAAKKQGIKAYFYTDVDAWKNFDLRNQGDVSMLTGQEKTGGYVSTHPGFLIGWAELMQAKSSQTLGDKAKKLVRDIQREYDRDRAVRELRNEMGNARKPNAGPDRKHAINIIEFMRKNKLKTLSDFATKMAEKWSEDA